MTSAPRSWPSWLADAARPVRALPTWLASVPTPRTREGWAIDDDARARLLAALERDDELVAEFEVWLEPVALREHAWAVVDAWAANGSDPRHRWVLAGLNEVSDDELEERLVPSCDLETAGATGVLRRELTRLERALSSGRDWSVMDWRHWLLEHRLMRHVVPSLVWAQRSKRDGSRLSRTFRVDGRGELTDVEHRPVELDPRERVCLLHPIDLDEVERAAWGELVAELELIPPFAQLARPIHLADSTDMAGDTVCRFASTQIRTPALFARLRRRGWTSGEPGERMRIRHFIKAFLHLGTHAVLTIEPGLGPKGDGESALHRIDAVHFLERRPGGVTFETEPRIPLARVAPIALSEILYDLAALAQ